MEKISRGVMVDGSSSEEIVDEHIQREVSTINHTRFPNTIHVEIERQKLVQRGKNAGGDRRNIQVDHERQFKNIVSIASLKREGKIV